MSDLQKASLQEKSNGTNGTNGTNDYNTIVNDNYLYTNTDGKYNDINDKPIHGRYFHYVFESAKFVRYFEVKTDGNGTPTLSALYGKEEDTGKWRMLKALNESDMNKKINVYPLKAFKEYIFVILEIDSRGSHNVSRVDIYGGPLIDPVKKHHAHFEHFTGLKKNVSFDESKNEMFMNNPRKISKWIIPSALAILLTSLLYKKIRT